MSGNSVTLKRDRKAKDCWLITTTDSEGFHRQLPITGNLFDDIDHNAPLDKPLEDWEGEHHDTR